jgi:hypothetical protein
VNSKHRKTLAAVFGAHTPAGLVWADLEGLLKAAGCQVIEGPGSAVSFRSGREIEFLHRPHPAKEAKRYQVRAARAFLIRMGVKP